MIGLNAILLIAALVCFGLATLRIHSPVDLTALGLALVVLSKLI